MDDWRQRVAEAFLSGYRELVDGAPGLWPESGGEELLTLLMLDKALYELRYEIDNRPDWVRVPVHGLLRLAGLGTLSGSEA